MGFVYLKELSQAFSIVLILPCMGFVYLEELYQVFSIVLILPGSRIQNYSLTSKECGMQTKIPYFLIL
jgi:hypothetical protein